MLRNIWVIILQVESSDLVFFPYESPLWEPWEARKKGVAWLRFADSRTGRIAETLPLHAGKKMLSKEARARVQIGICIYLWISIISSDLKAKQFKEKKVPISKAWKSNLIGDFGWKLTGCLSQQKFLFLRKFLAKVVAQNCNYSGSRKFQLNFREINFFLLFCHVLKNVEI